MLTFFEWQFSNYNWIGPAVMYTVLFLWAAALGVRETRKAKVILYLTIFLGLGSFVNYLSSYEDGYRKYANHYTTCQKPEAKAANYLFVPERGRCYKPVVGLITVDNHDLIEMRSK